MGMLWRDSIRVDNPDASFQAIVKGAFPSSASQDLSFDDHILSAYAR